jgi:RNA polymerase sigma factor (sigma-70 family)
MLMIAPEQDSLVMALQEADIEQPVRLLYEQYFSGVVTQIVANGGTEEDGADVFQEAVLVLIDKVRTGSFRGDSSVKTFLSAIARNLWLHEIRTRDRRRKREQWYSGTEDIMHPATAPLPKQSQFDLMEVLAQIGDACKKILTGFYYEEKSMRDMLSEFDYENEQVLRNKKSKCMKRLKELLSTNTTLLENLKNAHFYER